MDLPPDLVASVLDGRQIALGNDVCTWPRKIGPRKPSSLPSLCLFLKPQQTQFKGITCVRFIIFAFVPWSEVSQACVAATLLIGSCPRSAPKPIYSSPVSNHSSDLPNSQLIREQDFRFDFFACNSQAHGNRQLPVLRRKNEVIKRGSLLLSVGSAGRC